MSEPNEGDATNYQNLAQQKRDSNQQNKTPSITETAEQIIEPIKRLKLLVDPKKSYATVNNKAKRPLVNINYKKACGENYSTQKLKTELNGTGIIGTYKLSMVDMMTKNEAEYITNNPMSRKSTPKGSRHPPASK